MKLQISIDRKTVKRQKSSKMILSVQQHELPSPWSCWRMCSIHGRQGGRELISSVFRGLPRYPWDKQLPFCAPLVVLIFISHSHYMHWRLLYHIFYAFFPFIGFALFIFTLANFRITILFLNLFMRNFSLS